MSTSAAQEYKQRVQTMVDSIEEKSEEVSSEILQACVNQVDRSLRGKDLYFASKEIIESKAAQFSKWVEWKYPPEDPLYELANATFSSCVLSYFSGPKSLHKQVSKAISG